MDAPPDKEDLAAYLRVSALLEQCGVHVPHVHAHDGTLGFALLEDLGNTHMLTALAEGADAARLYEQALDELARLQLAGEAASHSLPSYDRATLLREMQLLPDWYCLRHLGFEPDAAQLRTHRTVLRLAGHARRWHSRRCSCIATIIRAT